MDKGKLWYVGCLGGHLQWVGSASGDSLRFRTPVAIPGPTMPISGSSRILSCVDHTGQGGVGQEMVRRGAADD